jgi:hypothetical protein
MPATNSFSSMAFIGLPWPRNSTGIFGVLRKGAVILFIELYFIISFTLTAMVMDLSKS